MGKVVLVDLGRFYGNTGVFVEDVSFVASSEPSRDAEGAVIAFHGFVTKIGSEIQLMPSRSTSHFLEEDM